MNSMLIEVIDRLDELDDSDPYDPLEIYAEGGRDAEPQSRAVVCSGDEEGTKACPQESIAELRAHGLSRQRGD